MPTIEPIISSRACLERCGLLATAAGFLGKDLPDSRFGTESEVEMEIATNTCFEFLAYSSWQGYGAG